MRIDFISDISCPWCAIGASALECALQRIGDDIPVELHFRPFELNPDMPPAGEGLESYLERQLGMDREQIAAANAMLHERGAAVGFEFGHRSRVWNTFDAHRLLSWADAQGPAGSQRKLKLSLLRAYHGEDRNPGAHDLLLDLAGAAGLDIEQARTLLASDAFAAEVRDDQRRWRQMGIHPVPTMIINGQSDIAGARSADEYLGIIQVIQQEQAQLPEHTR